MQAQIVKPIDAQVNTYLASYVRCLYADLSPLPGDIGPYTEYFAFERVARQRNLRATLIKLVKPMADFLGSALFDNVIHEFCNSDAFWKPICPSVAEAFCHFIRFRYNDRPSLVAIATVLGVKLGLYDGKGCMQRWKFESAGDDAYKTLLYRRITDQSGQVCVSIAMAESEIQKKDLFFVKLEPAGFTIWFEGE
jgi:hypothetical protein